VILTIEYPLPAAKQWPATIRAAFFRGLAGRESASASLVESKIAKRAIPGSRARERATSILRRDLVPFLSFSSRCCESTFSQSSRIFGLIDRSSMRAL